MKGDHVLFNVDGKRRSKSHVLLPRHHIRKPVWFTFYHLYFLVVGCLQSSKGNDIDAYAVNSLLNAFPLPKHTKVRHLGEYVLLGTFDNKSEYSRELSSAGFWSSLGVLWKGLALKGVDYNYRSRNGIC